MPYHPMHALTIFEKQKFFMCRTRSRQACRPYHPIHPVTIFEKQKFYMREMRWRKTMHFYSCANKNAYKHYV